MAKAQLSDDTIEALKLAANANFGIVSDVDTKIELLKKQRESASSELEALLNLILKRDPDFTPGKTEKIGKVSESKGIRIVGENEKKTRTKRGLNEWLLLDFLDISKTPQSYAKIESAIKQRSPKISADVIRSLAQRMLREGKVTKTRNGDGVHLILTEKGKIFLNEKSPVFSTGDSRYQARG